MIALSETCSSPTYTGEFRELNWERLKPPGIRYQPRETPLIGMNSTEHPNRWKSETSTLISKAARKNAAKSQSRIRAAKPQSIGMRVLAAMRKKGVPMSTGEMIELANKDMPTGCIKATKGNIYEALKPLRKRGAIELIHDDGQYVNHWRLTK